MVSPSDADPSRLRGARILVTGADGFIGSHLVERLVGAGATVRALALYTSAGTHGWLDAVPAEVRREVDLRRGDIRDAGLVLSLAADQDVILHLASLIAIPYSYEAPRSFVSTNVDGVVNVLEAARVTGSRVVNTSTSEVYGTPDTVPIGLGHRLRAQSPYAASKIAADKLCESYAASFGVRVTTLRPFNTYGPRQSRRAIIPTLLAQMLAGARTVAVGSLAPRRDFTYVADTVEAFARMASADLEPGSLVQLGAGRSISIGELFGLCADVVGVDVEPRIETERLRPEASEVDILECDASSAHERLGWRASVELREGLQRTLEWLQEHPVDPSTVGTYER